MEVLRRHWPEYLIEALGLGLFMISASVVTLLLEHPSSPLRQSLPDPVMRRFLIGLGMGLTAIALIYSPWGMRSGAHLNPAVTLTFLRLGKVKTWDALGYVLAQFGGGALGLWLAAAFLAPWIAAVDYVVTVPGPWGVGGAFGAELMISFVLMLMVLFVSNTPKLAHLTGLFSGLLVATYITVEAPLSGMSMNPARTLASALSAQVWTGVWVYFTAPPLGMLLAAQVYLQFKGHRQGVRCAKLQHPKNDPDCIFCGNFSFKESRTRG
jgi:aquaporin Z